MGKKKTKDPALLHIIMRNDASDEYNTDARFSMVRVTAESIRKLLGYQQLFDAVHASAPEVVELRLDCGDDPDYYADDSPFAVGGLVSAFDSDEDVEVAFEQDDFIVVEGVDLDHRDWSDTTSVELVRVCVYACGVQWTCVLKYGSVSVDTPRLEWETLVRIHAQLLMMEET